MTIEEQEQRKIYLEEILRKELTRLFLRIVLEQRVAVATGTTIRASRYQPEFEALLNKHYARVQQSFLGITDTKAQTEEDNDEVVAALLLWMDKTSAKTADELTKTTQNDMDTSLAQARQSLANEGNTSYSQRELAVLAAVMLGRIENGRLTSIVVTETQKAAESTKLIESYDEAGLNPTLAVTGGVIPTAVIAMKEWRDVGDAKVRRGHHAGEVAKVRITEPFMVRGEMLMYPGDGSMGASAGNIINCRCGTFYTIGG